MTHEWPHLSWTWSRSDRRCGGGVILPVVQCTPPSVRSFARATRPISQTMAAACVSVSIPSSTSAGMGVTKTATTSSQNVARSVSSSRRAAASNPASSAIPAMTLSTSGVQSELAPIARRSARKSVQPGDDEANAACPGQIPHVPLLTIVFAIARWMYVSSIA